jgi:uroporphyrinogen-III decarboxylase
MGTPTHAGFLRKLTGFDPFERTEEAVVQAVVKLDIDLLAFGLPVRAQGSESDEHLYGLNPTDWRHEGRGPEDLFSYDPVKFRDDLPALPHNEAVRLIKARLAREKSLVGETALTAVGYTFTTCVHYAAEDLDWVRFLIACVTEPDSVDGLLDRFQAASEGIFRAHAATDIEVMFSHDDIAMATGTVQSPDWLRQHVIRRYREIWRPVKENGIPLIFMTDGDFQQVATDLVEAGAEGFFLDQPSMDLARLVEQCGPDLMYFTGPSPATMTTGSPADVRAAVRDFADMARPLPRFFFHVPGGYTRNMPTDNVEAYYDACREFGAR